MKILVKNPAQIITVNTSGVNFKRGKELNETEVLENHSIIIENGLIKDFIKKTDGRFKFDKIIDAEGLTVLPGLIDCHTHTIFAGSRAEEFRLKLSGEGYEEIARKGGGILSTVKAVRDSSFEELVNISKPRIDYFIRQGITTLEIKSGYGLSFYDEIKLLQVIQHLDKIYPIDIVPTFLGAHTYPPEYNNDHERYIEIITEELIPYISENNLAEFTDAFCEKTAFTADEVDRIFEVSLKHGLKLKLHTEQFNNIGGLETALKYKTTSVDHLEVLKDEQVDELKNSDTVSVLLPGVSFFLDYDYAPARKLIDNNSIVALATDYNPGSSHIADLNFIMSLAALKMKMSIEEVIASVTINAAKALRRENETGSLEIGKKADLSIFDTGNYSDIVYNIGKNLCVKTVKEGEVIFSKNQAD